MGTRLQYSQPEQKDDDECPSLQSCSLVGVEFWSLQRMNKKEIPFIDLNIFRDFLCVFLSFKWNNFRILMKMFKLQTNGVTPVFPNKYLYSFEPC